MRAWSCASHSASVLHLATAAGWANSAVSHWSAVLDPKPSITRCNMSRFHSRSESRESPSGVE